jgi:serine/threonine protein kinase
MSILQDADDELSTLVGVDFPSSAQPGVSYQLEKLLGVGGMGSAFLARRSSPGGRSLVVVKVMHPGFVLDSGKVARTSFQKEVVALQRLQQHVPPNPFVVRHMDTGWLPVRHRNQTIDLPWLVIDYVHGGIAGTTLQQRVEHSVATTNHAFDPVRAAHAIGCIASGLSAIHEVGVVHRDLKPDNVLCCGARAGEIFKITDFGVARPLGLAATFGNVFVGTPGYAAPEQSSADGNNIGAWSDIFAMACIVYFLLTGQNYFEPRTPAESLLLARDPKRASLRKSPHLSPELARAPSVCEAIDRILARATAYKFAERPLDAKSLAEPILAQLRGISPRRPSVAKAGPSFENASTSIASWSWSVLQQHQDHFMIRSVAWSADGRCLAATTDGLVFWDGNAWLPLARGNYPDIGEIRFVRRVGPGRWMIGGDRATLATLSAEGKWDVSTGEDPSLGLHLASGDLDDLGVVVSENREGGLALHAIVAHRWLRALPLPGVSSIISLARVHDDRWLLAGRKRDGSGYAALYFPTQWHVEELAAPPTRSYLSCVGQPESSSGLITGVGGQVIVVGDRSARVEHVGTSVDLAATAMDPGGRVWAASRGSLWLRSSEAQRPWSCVWSDPRWTSPIVALCADSGLVQAISVDGAVLEGRMAV